MKRYSLALTTGVDIPIPEIKGQLHQPTIKEISLLGTEENFFLALQFLSIKKETILPDEELIKEMTDFDVFMTLINDKKQLEVKNSIILLLTLLFPTYTVAFFPKSMNFFRKRGDEIDSFLIDENNFEDIREIIKDVFCVNRLMTGNKTVYNPKGARAEEIVQKIMKGRERLAQQKHASKEGVFDTYISILTVGLQKDWNDLTDYTVYQLFREMDRYNLWMDWDLVLRQKLAGAQNVRNAENWMKELD